MTADRFALVVLDGLGDLPHPETGGRSPVVAARTPYLDRVAAGGAVGQVVLIGPGIAPESDAGVLALLGYDPATDSPGRGVLEAIGVGIPLEPGDVALRMNFATAGGDGEVVDSRVGRTLSTEEATDLARTISQADLLADEGIHAEVRPTVGHRGVLWLHPTRGEALSANVSNSDPFYERTGGMGHAAAPTDTHPRTVEPLDGSAAAARTARALNDFLARVPAVLAGHRVTARRALRGAKLPNALLVRHAGRLPERPPQPFASRYGRAGAAVTEMPVERGIARLLGLEDIFVGPMGPDRDSALRERARVARTAMDRHPFVYVHLKGPDEPGHDGLAVRKLEVIEAIDRSFFGPFLDGLDTSRARFAVTADHSTPAILKRHSDDPVPLVIAGAGVAPHGGAAGFGAPPGPDGLGMVVGRDVLRRLFADDPSAPLP